MPLKNRRRKGVSRPLKDKVPTKMQMLKESTWLSAHAVRLSLAIATPMWGSLGGLRLRADKTCELDPRNGHSRPHSAKA
jgi:hypothetical protein